MLIVGISHGVCFFIDLHAHERKQNKGIFSQIILKKWKKSLSIVVDIYRAQCDTIGALVKVNIYVFYIMSMADTSKLNKALWTNITKLKLLNKEDAPVKFLFDKSPFNDNEDEISSQQAEYVIVGRILPNSDIFKESAFQIEMKLTSSYPFEPPEVRFLTPIYHPNIDKNGRSIISFTEEVYIL